MTTIINLYGGPGTGKSTSAAKLFAMMKDRGLNVELVREYVKEWAWENRPISVYDQIYFLGKQSRKESLLYGKVDYIVTDSPVLMSAAYASLGSKELYGGIWYTATAFYNLAKEEGHKHVHVYLERSKAYNPAGRFQTEEEAIKMDKRIRKMLAIFAPNDTIISQTSDEALTELLGKIVP